MRGEDARISVFDRGFLFGDAIYEVMRTMRGRPLFWRAHWERLEVSASLVQMPLGDIEATLRAEVEATLAAARQSPAYDESYIRIIVTRGEGEVDIDLAAVTSPTRIVMVKPMPRVPEALIRDGCKLATFRTGRRDEGGLDPRAKGTSTMLAVLAQVHARRARAYEALRVDPLGRILEGATSTFFRVRDGVLETPPLGVGILVGITRAEVMELAKSVGIEQRETSIHLDDLHATDEVFITSSVRGIVPVSQIDDLEFGPPGPVTKRLYDGYAERIERAVAM